MSKYYTPGLEEFHIGFRYEYRDNGEYIPKELRTINQLTYVNAGLRTLYMNGSSVRVKYLDEKDITELGWQLKTSEVGARELARYYSIDNKYWLIDAFGGDISIFKHEVKSNITEIFTQGTPLFQGTCKNYNELKDIMKKVWIK